MKNIFKNIMAKFKKHDDFINSGYYVEDKVKAGAVHKANKTIILNDKDKPSEQIKDLYR